MRIKSKASKLISVLLVAVMIVTTVSVSFAETEQISDVTTPAAQDADNASEAEVSSTSASDDAQASDSQASDAQVSDNQASDTQASDTQEADTKNTESADVIESDVASAEGTTEEEAGVSEEEMAEEGMMLFAEQGYTIKFDSNGGDGTPPKAITTDKNGNFTFPDKGSMSRSGYIFMGWGQDKTTGHCDTSNDNIPKTAKYYSIYETGEKGSVRHNTTYYAVWAKLESAQYFIRLDGTVPREPGDYSTSLYTDQVGTGKTVAKNTFYANSNVADNGVASHLGTTPTTAEIMRACNDKAGDIRFSDGSRYERCSNNADFEKKYYVIWYVVKRAGTIHVDGSLLKKSLYNVTYEPNAKAGEYTGTVPAAKQYAAGETVAVEKSNLQRDGYTFAGWELSIDGKIYNAGSTFKMPAGNVVLKAIWERECNLSYTVNYLDQSTGDAIADPKVVGDKHYGDEVTETAIDIDGYDKVKPVSETITISKGENVINFYYTKRTDLSYTVKYMEKDTTNEIATAKTVNGQTFGAEITEGAIDIAGYNKVDPTSKTITIGTGSNVINFYYTKRTDLTYTVNYLEYGTNKVLHDPKTVENQVLDSTASESAIDIAGYNKKAPTSVSIKIAADRNIINFYYEKRTDLSYTVNYLEYGTDTVLHDPKTVNDQTFERQVTENAIDIDGYNKYGDTVKTITIGAIGQNVINFYYTKRTDLEYTVNYLEKGTDNVLATAKSVKNQTFGTTVEEEAITINGYNLDSAAKQSIQIGTGTNVINFYYKARTDLSYTVKYMEKNTTTEIATALTVNNQTFGTSVNVSAIDIDGYTKVAPTSVTIEIKDDNSKNEIIFYYTKRTDLSYTVNYLEQGTNAVLAAAKTVDNQTFGAKVPVSAIDINGYNKVAPTTAEIEITTGTNEHTFYYTKRTDLSYTINYYKNSVRADSKLGDTVTVDKQTYLDEVSLDSDTINARKPSSDYYDGEVSADKIVIKVSGNNFDIVYKKKPEMSIEAAGYEGKYDGAAHSGTVTSSAEKGETVYTYYQIIGDETKKLDSAPSVTDVQRDAEGNVITLHYMVEASNDEYSAPEPAYFDIKITPLQISIFWARNINYDGLVHTFEIGTSKDQTEDGVFEGETLYHNATISGQAAGTYDKVSDYSWCVYKSDEKTDSTVNYDIEIGALLTISKARPDTKLSLDIDSYKGVYDGQEHERLAIFQAPAGIAASTEIQYSRDGKNWTTDVPSIKNVGKETCYVRAYNESFIDDEYPMQEYTLEVTPRNLIIYAEAEYMFDGQEKVLNITADDLVDTDSRDEGLAEGEFLSLENAQIKGTEAGVYTEVSEYSAVVVKLYNKPDADEPALMVDADAAEFELTTDNYNIQVAGKLTITSIAANDPAGKNAKGDSDKGSDNGTKTGDATPVGILFGLLALAACGGGFAAFGRRKREE